MDVVWHKAISVYPACAFTAIFCQQFQIKRPVVIIEKYRLSIVAPLDYVVWVIKFYYSR